MAGLFTTGALEFADEARLELGLDAYFATEADAFYGDIDHVRRDGLAVSIVIDEDDAGSHHLEPTIRKVTALARYAERGEIVCNGHRVVAGVADRSDTAPRHYRYDAYFAAKAGDAARLRDLVALGATLDTHYPKWGKTLLHVAVGAEAVEAIEVLLAAGVDVNARDNLGGTPLWNARLAATRVLLAAGADPNADEARYSSLLEVASYQPGEVVEALLAAGAIPRADDVGLATTCAALGQVARLRAFVERTPEFRASLVKPEVVAKAISSRDIVTLDFLLEQGATLPADFLAQAIRWGAVAFVESALRAPDAIAACGPSNDERDAMCLAARSGRVEVMTLLAERGVPVHPTSPGATSPFFEAARGGHADALRWLIARGVPVDTSAAYDTTRAEALMIFVEHGVDPHDGAICDDEEWSAEQLHEFRRLLAEWRAKQ